jgi:hypothetical protein
MAKFCSRSDSYLLQYGLVFYLCLLGQFLGRSRSSRMVPNKGLQMSYISRPSIESNLIKDLDHCIDLTESHSGLIILIRLLVDLLEQSTHDLISQVILDVQKARLHFFPHERIFLDRNTPSLLANANYILSIYTHILSPNPNFSFSYPLLLLLLLPFTREIFKVCQIPFFTLSPLPSLSLHSACMDELPFQMLNL